MTTRRERHVSPEKSLTMEERLQRVDEERAHIDAFDQDPQAAARSVDAASADCSAGRRRLVPRDWRIRQEPASRSGGGGPPADGVITGYAEVGGRRVVVLAEDPVALARTDAQVGKGKRNRMISSAIYRRLPLIYVADGTAEESPEFDMHKGFLLSRVADQLPARDVAEREAPFVTVACGLCAGQNGSLAVRSDLLVATRDARFGAQGGSPETVADLVCEDDASAIEAAQVFLGTLPEELGTPLESITGGPVAPTAALSEEDMSASPRQQFEAIFDADGAVLLGPSDGGCSGWSGTNRRVPGRVCPHWGFASVCARCGRCEADRPRRLVERRLPDSVHLDAGHARLRPGRCGDVGVHVRRGADGGIVARLECCQDHNHHWLGLPAR